MSIQFVSEMFAEFKGDMLISLRMSKIIIYTVYPSNMGA